MRDNNKPNPSPSTGNREKSESNDRGRVVTESVEYGEMIKGGFDVANSMPPPPNPDRGGNKNDQGDK